MTEALPWAVAGLIALGAGGYVVHCEQVKKDHAEFVGKLKQQAADQKRENDQRADRERKAKETADAKAKREIGNLHRTIERLRNDSASASLVPASSSCPGSADTTTAAFDRAELDRALRNFTEGVSSLVGEGEQARIELNAARDWAAEALK